MHFDQGFIDKVRTSVSIVELVSNYVSLKKSGQNYAGLCPFHGENTPSFLVSDSKQIFKCFGCGAGGDVFKFAVLIENLSFPEAIQFLAERSGIPLPPRGDRPDGDQGEQRRRLLEIMSLAHRFFQHCLRGSTGEQARRYLERRGLDAGTIDKFSLGFAPGGHQLVELLAKEGQTEEDLLACGLVKEGQTGRVYERFRNRIMFPIRDLSGHTIAFGGRTLGDGVPKYLNSPDTPLYKKSLHLFALDVSRDEIRRRDFAILVEGYFDCVVPHQFGFRNVAASLGTSLTPHQVKLLGRYTRNVIVNFDPDSAGVAATMRSIDLFLEQGFRVNIARLPSGDDPDTFLQREGAQPYQALLKASLPFIEFALARFVSQQRDPFSPRGKQEIIDQIVPYLMKLPHKIERSEYVSRIASQLRVEDGLIMSEMRKTSGRAGRTRPLRPTVRSLEKATQAEITLLGAVLDPRLSAAWLPLLGPELFEGLSTQSIFQKVLELRELEQEISIVSLRNELQEEEEAIHLLDSVSLGAVEVTLSEESLRGSLLALRKKQYERLSRRLQEEIKKEEASNSKSLKI
ncbi:MAG: DNA primase, partial [Acidobacteriota bacterium]